jgi:membrane protein implicated in regulation of membrane protease activity
VILPVVAGLSAILFLLARLGFVSQRRRPTTGAAGMLGTAARALVPMTPGAPGRVSTHGEIWNATASEPVAAGEEVVVTAVDGLTLTVSRTRPRP